MDTVIVGSVWQKLLSTWELVWEQLTDPSVPRCRPSTSQEKRRTQSRDFSSESWGSTPREGRLNRRKPRINRTGWDRKRESGGTRNGENKGKAGKAPVIQAWTGLWVWMRVREERNVVQSYNQDITWSVEFLRIVLSFNYPSLRPVPPATVWWMKVITNPTEQSRVFDIWLRNGPG